METRRIGSLQASVVGLGGNNFGWRLNEAATARVVEAAREAGITFFDTADVYGGTKSEEYLGKALAPYREQVVIATKFGSRIDDRRKGGAKPEYVRQAAEESLRRLGTGYIDLYQLHWPDPETPTRETLAVLEELVQAGKVREIGCSNFSVEQLQAAEAAARDRTVRFVSVQNQYSLLHRDPELDVIPECVHADLAFIPYFPLASGLLSGKYRRGQPPPEGSRLASGRGGGMFTDRNMQIVESLRQFAESRGHTLLELAISWLVSRPAVASVIAGATSADQVRANAAAANWRLSEEELAAVDRIAPPPMEMRRAA